MYPSTLDNIEPKIQDGGSIGGMEIVIWSLKSMCSQIVVTKHLSISISHLW